MKHLFIPFLFVLVACGDDENPSARNSRESVPQELYSRHVSDFYDYAAMYDVEVEQVSPKVYWKDINDFSTCGGALFVSESTSDNKVTIFINDEFKVYENDQNFGVIIFREMARQLLNKPYAPQPIDGTTKVIMHQCAATGDFENSNIKEAAIEYLFTN